MQCAGRYSTILLQILNSATALIILRFLWCFFYLYVKLLVRGIVGMG